MPRMMNLQPEKTYRAVLLTLYTGMVDNWYTRNGLMTYTDTNGHVHQYHAESVYGPFAKPAQANAAITRGRASTRADGSYYNEAIQTQTVFLESTDAVWTKQ